MNVKKLVMNVFTVLGLAALMIGALAGIGVIAEAIIK